VQPIYNPELPRRRMWQIVVPVLAAACSALAGTVYMVPALGAEPPAQEPARGISLSVPAPAPVSPSNDMPAMEMGPVSSPSSSPYSYNPAGRRDPFAAIVKDGNPRDDAKLGEPPLQRMSLAELNLIGIIWGGFGYSAMLQTPD
jgi:hypothetical protein